MTSPYSGDPKINIDKNGMYFAYRNGQPVMDQGLENAAMLQLLTDSGWHGNAFLTQPIGSKFEETARRPITRTALSDVEKAAEAALTVPVFGDKDITVVNPESYRLDVTATIKPPGFDSGVIRVERNGENWLNQRNSGTDGRPYLGRAPQVTLLLPQTGTTADFEFVLTSGAVKTIYADGDISYLQNPPPKTFPVDEARVNRVVFSEPNGVTEVYLPGNNLTGNIPPELGNLSNLQYLYMYFNQITGNIPPELGNLSNLTRLYLYRNNLTGNIPPELGNLNNLQYLILDNNQITGNMPPELGNLNNLQYLYLNNNQITGNIPPELGGFGGLIQIYLSDNQFSQTDLSTFVTVLWGNRVTLGGNACAIKLEGNNGLTADAIARIEGTGVYAGDGLVQAGCTVTY